jgi:hypothetical protein
VAEPPRIDGKLDDAAWDQAEHAAIARLARSPAALEEDRTGYWMAAYDDENLYLACEIDDDAFFGHALEGLLDYNNDTVELFLEPLANYRVNMQYRLWPLGRDGQGAEVTKRPTWGRWDIAGSETSAGYILELAIPLAHFQETVLRDIREGDIIGFDLAVVDQRSDVGGKTERVVTHWAGDGTNWQYAEQNGLLSLGEPDADRLAQLRPDFTQVGETPVQENGAVWPDLELVSGRTQLEILHQSSSATQYQPWRLGGVGHPLLEHSQPGDALMVGDEIGPHSGGEHMDAEPRYIEATFTGEREGRALELRMIRTPFHPALLYQTNAAWISFFNDMAKAGQPHGPTGLAFALESGAQVRPVDEPGSVLYDVAKDGPLAEGWLLTLMARPGDGMDFDMPVALFPSRAPSRITCNEAGGLTFIFADNRPANVALLPLYGLAPVETARTAQWLVSGELPQDTVERLRRWQAWSAQLPVDCNESWQYLPQQKRFRVTHRFNYTAALSEWDQPGERLALLPPLFWRPDAAGFYRCPPLEDLDYATWFGPLMGTGGSATMTYELPVPQLADTPPRLDPEILAQTPQGSKYMAELLAMDVPDLLRKNFRARQKRGGAFMPHTFPVGSKENVSAALAVEPPQKQETLRTELLGVHESETFNPAKRDEYFPPAAPYLGSAIRYANLTYPYGVAEPYHGITNTFTKVYQLGKGLGDQRLFTEHWEETKRIADIIWAGGFCEYRYDGGTLLGDSLLGLLDVAETLGDEDYATRVRFRLAEYAATAWSYYAARTWLAGIGAWDRGGASPRTLGEIQMRTRSGFAAIDDGSAYLDYCYIWDRSLGNPAILRPFALAQIEALEARADEINPQWYLPEPNPPVKRVDGIVRRFETRALVLREPLPQLEVYLAGMKDRLGQPTAYAACLAVYLARVQEDALAGQL